MDENWTYELIRSRRRRRTLSLRLTPEGQVVIRAPWRLPREAVDAFFAARKKWIEQKLKARTERPSEAPAPLGDGSTVLYLGNPYPLQTACEDRGRCTVRFNGTAFELSRPGARRPEDLLATWFREEARRLLPSRVEALGQAFHLQPQGVRITGARTRWGSCSAVNRVSLSWRLLMAPLRIIDYVILHELAHLREKNHSKRFWTFLETLHPDWRESRLWLKRHGAALSQL
jgi:predicted metal-dependent hydrolase